MAKFYEVGGCVRDRFMGVRSKDVDYAVECKSFDSMRQAILDRGGQIFLETPQYFTIRAKVPKLGPADFVLCRRESNYSDGRHPDKVEVGTIYDDLARRDFTMNAIAVDEDGKVIDPHNGEADINRRVIKAVGEARDRFTEDALRLLRAIRFSITKDMQLDSSIWACLNDPSLIALLKNVSPERIREELLKCFKHDTIAMLDIMNRSQLRLALFKDTGIWLKPSMEE